MENIRVFLIENQEDFQNILVQLIRREGFNVIGTATTADEGLRQVQQRQGEIDVVIVDTMLPDSDRVITTIVDNAPRIAVVVLTPSVPPAGYQILNVVYAVQPITPERLTAAIRESLGQRRTTNGGPKARPPQAPPPPTQAAPRPAPEEPGRSRRDEAPSLWDKFGESLSNIKEDVKKALGGTSDDLRGGERAPVQNEQRGRPIDDGVKVEKPEAPAPPRQQQPIPPPQAAPPPHDLDEREEEPVYRGIPKEAFEEAEQEAPPPPRGIPSPITPPATIPAPAPPEPKPEVIAPGAAPSPSHDIQFSAYYPREVKPMDWQPLIAYLFKQSAGPTVATDAKKILGDRSDIRTTGRPSTQAIAEGATVMATPRLDGFQFNPPSISVGFFEDWHRFDFKLRANGAPLDQAANGFVTFTVEGVIVADVPLSIFVTESVSAATQQAEAQQKPYQSIFCSYSHKDTNIIERVERAYKALGMDYLRDVTTLKSGQEWNAELLKMIERADIFQLFWSSNSAMSKYVAQEYEHALGLKRPGPFVRPVYWEQPMPKVPDPLRPFHFAFEPTLDDDLPQAGDNP